MLTCVSGLKAMQVAPDKTSRKSLGKSVCGTLRFTTLTAMTVKFVAVLCCLLACHCHAAPTASNSEVTLLSSGPGVKGKSADCIGGGGGMFSRMGMGMGRFGGGFGMGGGRVVGGGGGGGGMPLILVINTGSAPSSTATTAAALVRKSERLVQQKRHKEADQQLRTFLQS